MELMLILRVLRRRWWLVLVPLVVVVVIVIPDLLRNRAAASGGYTTFISYTAAQVLDVPGRDGDYQDIWLASQLTVNALTDWVRTGSFAEEVARNLAAQGIEINPTTLGIAADNDFSIGQLFLSWPDEAQLKLIAAAAIDVLGTRTQAYFPQLGDHPAQVRVLNEPLIAAAPPPIVDRFAPLLKLGLGLVAGVGLAFLAEYLDPTVRGREQVEALGLPVIASIPRE
jgi:capsular polysaccharide biosynthesis protein